MATIAAPHLVSRPTRVTVWLSLLPLPAWIVFVVLLFAVGALGEESVVDRPLAEQAAYLQRFPAGEASAWAVALLMIVAIAVAGVALLGLVRDSRSRRANAVRTLAVVGTTTAVFSGVHLLGLLGADPQNLPAWVDLPRGVLQALDVIGFASLSLAAGLASFTLRQMGLLGRAGRGLGIAGIAFSVIAVGLPLPWFHAILLFVIGGMLARAAADH